MTDEQPKTRSIVHEIEIDAPIETVWKALTEAEELTRWFSELARVTPGVGGSYWVSWGEGQSGESRVEAWEPGRRILLRNLPWESNEGGHWAIRREGCRRDPDASGIHAGDSRRQNGSSRSGFRNSRLAGMGRNV